MPVSLKPTERLHFCSSMVAIGDFVCSPRSALFRDSGPTTKTNFSFPRTNTEIRRSREPRFVEGPDTVTLFNRGEAFSQRRVSAEGVRTDWFVIEDGVLLGSIRRRAPHSLDPTGAPFGQTHVPCDDSLYLRQRRIVGEVRRGRFQETDVEEAVLRLLESILERIHEAGARRGPSRRAVRTRDLVEGAKAILAETFRQPLRLASVAQELDTSPSYLCRVFRAETGLSLSDYRRICRLRIALEAITDRDLDLASLADEMGFASHSHFTYAFRRSFGVAPSLLRDPECHRASLRVPDAASGLAIV